MHTKIEGLYKVFDIVIKQKNKMDLSNLRALLWSKFENIIENIYDWHSNGNIRMRFQLKWMDEHQTQQTIAAIQKIVEEYLEGK